MNQPATIGAASVRGKADTRRRGRDSYEGIETELREFALMPPGTAEWRAARERMVRRCLPLADHIARRFTGRGENYDDLHQVASLGLVLAIDRFDPQRGDSFLAYAVPTIMGEVRRHFRDHTWSVRVPRRVKEIQLTIGPAVEDLAQRLGRMPTAIEIALELNLDLSEVTQALLAGNAYRTDSMDARADDDDASGAAPVSEIYGEDDPEYELTVQTMVASPLLDDLADSDKRVLYLRFFRDESQSQIAAKLGVSQMHISRTLTRILRDLRAAANR
ncbi:SigB/SigF/SigG family RNA polymerase sigma factor [Nocardia bovistercoris]|uniref:SigB/SigF/SigG family RNA polymerase sigma factor n=1 Tax=Nocardia bovistercoris TaxID=2785916 RepID=A0A931N3M7_9NOCA|nr:SigB/SigF/SigG family RNA polymerase sigma factor [Nocardia bovistercoris]MBH0777892.1 SigB/SigF/SigG family RNA polymerase sigma factor [Nocardia bovistercoris]